MVMGFITYANLFLLMYRPVLYGLFNSQLYESQTVCVCLVCVRACILYNSILIKAD